MISIFLDQLIIHAKKRIVIIKSTHLMKFCKTICKSILIEFVLSVFNFI